MNVSVAMATYNGEKYIKEQILSIISQLNKDDEIIVSDDGSTDKTLEIVKELQASYDQIKVISNPKKGVFTNFENAMMHCSKEIIFLSDQDDVWLDNKVKIVKEYFKKNSQTNVILHKAFIMKFESKTNNTMVTYKRGIIRNWIKSCYWGCCMAIRKEFIDLYLPFGFSGIAHDQLIGLLGEKNQCVEYVNIPLCYHRFHNENKTRKTKFLRRIEFRICLLRDFIQCELKMKRNTCL